MTKGRMTKGRKTKGRMYIPSKAETRTTVITSTAQRRVYSTMHIRIVGCLQYLGGAFPERLHDENSSVPAMHALCK